MEKHTPRTIFGGRRPPPLRLPLSCSTPHISCLGSAHLVLGFGSSHARLLSPHTSAVRSSCSASAHLMSGCSAPTHLVLSFGSSRARLRLISCPAAQPRSNNERLELCNSLSDEGDYSHFSIALTTLSNPEEVAPAVNTAMKMTSQAKGLFTISR
jgi:hypothetical protein